MAHEYTDQWNKLKSPKIGPNTYGIVICNKVSISNHWDKGEFDSK